MGTIRRSLFTHFINNGKIQALNLKGKKKSSQEWLQRQFADPYVEKARIFNYRCRSAFKLIEIDDRFKLLAPGQVVVDCGAAPGSWSQVVAQRSSPSSTIVAIDQRPIQPIDNVHVLANQDFTQSHDMLKHLLGETKVDVVLSDMAPNSTGIRSLDCEQILALCYSVLRFAVQVCAPEATLLVKLWQSGETQTFERAAARFFATVRRVKPAASRKESAEIFVLAQRFKGLKSDLV